MKYRDRFTDEDWTGVLEAPILAGLAITAADPGGLVSAVKESAAMARALKDAAAAAGEGALVTEIADAYREAADRDAASDAVKAMAKGQSPEALLSASVARLGAVMRTVEAALPEQADAFRTFLLDVAQKTAEASREGGFLGFGGEKVSEAERKALDQIAAVLKAPAA
jgi:hypothetical protein